MKPFVVINLDRIYRLRLTIGVILEYEQIAKKPLASARLDDENVILSLLWMMMRREIPEMTLTDTARKMTKLKNTIPLILAVAEVVKNAFTERKTDANTEPKYFDLSQYMNMAADIGVSVSDLCDMTPAEFDLRCKAYIKQRKIDRNNLYSQAWHTALFTRSKKLPDLNTYLVDIETAAEPKAMSPEEMLAKAKLLNAMYGGNVVEVC